MAEWLKGHNPGPLPGCCSAVVGRSIHIGRQDLASLGWMILGSEGRAVYVWAQDGSLHLRPYLHENTASRPISKVKHGRDSLVLSWETRWESGLLQFSSCRFNFCLSSLSCFLVPLLSRMTPRAYSCPQCCVSGRMVVSRSWVTLTAAATMVTKILLVLLCTCRVPLGLPDPVSVALVCVKLRIWQGRRDSLQRGGGAPSPRCESDKVGGTLQRGWGSALAPARIWQGRREYTSQTASRSLPGPFESRIASRSTPQLCISYLKRQCSLA